MINPGQPVTAAVNNAANMSRTTNTSTTGKVDVNNTTDSTAPTNGALHTTGGLGVEKKAFFGDDVSVSGDVSSVDVLASGAVSANSLTSTTSVSAQTGAFTTSITTQDVYTTDSSVSGNEVVSGNLTVLGDIITPNNGKIVNLVVIGTKAVPAVVSSTIDAATGDSALAVIAFVKSNGGAVQITLSDIVNHNTSVGAEITLIGCDDVDTVEITDGNMGPMLLENDRCVTYMYNGTYFFEKGRN